MNFDLKLHALRRLIDSLEDILEDSGDDSSLGLLEKIALHSVGLSRGRLAVCHQSSVPSLEQILHQRLSYLLVDFLLGSFLVENIVEVKREFLLLRRPLVLLLVFALNLSVLVNHKTRRVSFAVESLVLT